MPADTGDTNNNRGALRRAFARRFTRERPTRYQLLKRVRERAFAIGIANIPLIVFSALTVWAAYRKHGPNIFLFALVLCVSTVLAFLASSESTWDRTLSGLGLESQPASSPTSGRDSRDVDSSIDLRVPRAGLATITTLLFVAIVLDFWAVGYLMRTTGGVVHSPYNTVPATMLILGGLMTRSDATRVVIFVGGILFFLATNSLPVFGRETFPQAGHAFTVFDVFLVVTAVNLVVSYAIASRTQSLLPSSNTGDPPAEISAESE